MAKKAYVYLRLAFAHINMYQAPTLLATENRVREPYGVATLRLQLMLQF